MDATINEFQRRALLALMDADQVLQCYSKFTLEQQILEGIQEKI